MGGSAFIFECSEAVMDQIEAIRNGMRVRRRVKVECNRLHLSDQPEKASEGITTYIYSVPTMAN
jgi:hypothetical protein